MAGKSPDFEFDFLAARACSTEKAAGARSSALLRGGKNFCSCKTQQETSSEFIYFGKN
jgi:hypothetical protein